MTSSNSKVRTGANAIRKAKRIQSQSTSSRKPRSQTIERLELRQMLAVASPPDQSLLLTSPAIYLAPGHFDLGGPSDLLSVSRTGRIDLAVNNNQNTWATRSTYQVPGVSAANPVLGTTTALLNDDPFDDLVLQTASSVVMLVSDGKAGWQSYLTTNYTGVSDAASHPTVKPVVANLGNDTSIDLVLPLPQANQLAILYGANDGTISVTRLSAHRLPDQFPSSRRR